MICNCVQRKTRKFTVLRHKQQSRFESGFVVLEQTGY
jgi:hypothetical protein